MTQPGVIKDFRITTGFICCSRCGETVSNEVRAVGKNGIVIRAWVECPECIEKGPSEDADV